MAESESESRFAKREGHGQRVEGLRGHGRPDSACHPITTNTFPERARGDPSLPRIVASPDGHRVHLPTRQGTSPVRAYLVQVPKLTLILHMCGAHRLPIPSISVHVRSLSCFPIHPSRQWEVQATSRLVHTSRIPNSIKVSFAAVGPIAGLRAVGLNR